MLNIENATGGPVTVHVSFRQAMMAGIAFSLGAAIVAIAGVVAKILLYPLVLRIGLQVLVESLKR